MTHEEQDDLTKHRAFWARLFFKVHDKNEAISMGDSSDLLRMTENHLSFSADYKRSLW